MIKHPGVSTRLRTFLNTSAKVQHFCPDSKHFRHLQLAKKYTKGTVPFVYKSKYSPKSLEEIKKLRIFAVGIKTFIYGSNSIK